MFSKIRKITLAIAAIAALGTATLITSTDSADARGFGGGGGGFSRGGGGGMRMGGGGGFRMHGGGGMRSSIRGGGRVIGHRGGFGGRHISHHRPGRIHISHRRPHWGHCRWGRCGIHVGYRWRRPWVYPVAVGAVAATTYAVAPALAAPAPRCTCLTKEYTQDGLVVFQDVCTKEVASAPVGNTQVQLPQPQAPVQQ
jgi:hypothetical protein